MSAEYDAKVVELQEKIRGFWLNILKGVVGLLAGTAGVYFGGVRAGWEPPTAMWVAGFSLLGGISIGVVLLLFIVLRK